ncbi:putative sensor-like histidine kinase [Actinacidiphila reveromycinica]|uniref:histidine kinase n=1 Tax=Actinacidiphila reveromycinica TaxID=659352 RepID=A0A7U3VN06_9ACTN|nr:putative sensor-like histidine kinase [Streptomyces sp. SN-593]
MVVCGLACAGLVLGAPQGARTWVRAVSIGYGALLVAAVAWAGSTARRGRDAAARLAAVDARNAELRRKVAQTEAYIDGHQRRVAQMAAEADAAHAELAAARAGSERLNTRLEELAADARVLVEQAIPAMVGQLGAGASAGTALAAAPALADPRHRRVLEVFTAELAGGSRLRAATLAACANAAGRVQALTTTMMADLREMENRYDQDVLGDLLRLDHATAQAGRLADSIAVLTGGRSGRRWTKPIVMESILRGAIGRISAYQRVRLHSTSTAAVVGHAAEGVMHALAELVDNATRFSPPTETVHLYVEELTTGVVITVEDAGLVMSPPALRRAQHAVSHDPLRLGTLSGTRLGLAVVGGVAGKYGLTVSFRPSSRGGTGVLLLIPQHLITRPRESPLGSAAPRDRAAAPSAAAGGGPAASGEVVPGPGGLPTRQAGPAARTARPVPAPAASAEGGAWSSRPPGDTAADVTARHVSELGTAGGTVTEPATPDPSDATVPVPAPEAGPVPLPGPALDPGPGPDPDSGSAPASATASGAGSEAASGPGSGPVPVTASEAAAGGAEEDLFALPKRVRGRTLSRADHPLPGDLPPDGAPPAPRPPTGDMGARFGAFVAAGRRRREQTTRERGAVPQDASHAMAPSEEREAFRTGSHRAPDDGAHEAPRAAPYRPAHRPSHRAPRDDAP